MNPQEKERLRELAEASRGFDKQPYNIGAYERYHAVVRTPAAILSLLEENEALAKKSAAVDSLHQRLTHDGFGFWLPDLCVKGPCRSEDKPTMAEMLDEIQRAAMQHKGD